MTTKEKLEHIRTRMHQNNLDAYLIPITDPHMSEYVPSHWRTIEWFSGFSGSAGTIVVTQDFAGLWTDSRYFLQAEQQLEGSGIELVKLNIPHTPEYINWLVVHIREGGTVGCSGEVISVGLANQMKASFGSGNLKLRTDVDLAGSIWEDRPLLPLKPIFEHPTAFTGLSRKEKIGLIRHEMKARSVNDHLLTALDDIAWTFNIRGFDVKYSPVVIAFGLIGLDTCHLFINREKIPEQVARNLSDDDVEIVPYHLIYEQLDTFVGNGRIYLSPGSVNTRLYNSIPKGTEIKEGTSIPTMLKSKKNDTELSHIRETMTREGVALVSFFHWMDSNIGKIKITEMTIPEKLHEFRSCQEGYMGPSFATIAGYKGHGAIVHYEATPETDAEIKREGILLVDTGGQYLSGTTDMTRTIALSEPSAEEKRDFTVVLKGMIQLSMLRFPEGTRGYQIEAFARKAMWDLGLNYGHGTGHGIGYFLNVHEGPQTIGTGASGDRDVALLPGMILSNEPGYYREGQYGIRTENVLVVVEDRKTESGTFFRFETLTLCPIDRSLIKDSLLTAKERKWINDYHGTVYEKLSKHINHDIRPWLKSRTAPL